MSVSHDRFFNQPSGEPVIIPKCRAKPTFVFLQSRRCNFMTGMRSSGRAVRAMRIALETETAITVQFISFFAHERCLSMAEGSNQRKRRNNNDERIDNVYLNFRSL